MVKTCRFFASLGVTAIVNHHTHCVSGYEVYNNVPIFYSLGNFIFDWKYKKQNSWYEGFFVKLTINESSVDQIVLFPYYQCKNNVGLALMNEEEKSKFLEKIESYSEIIRNANLLENQWLKHCDSRKIDYLSNLLSLNKFQRQMLKRNIFSNLFLKKRKLLNLINLIRCESHREMIIDVIENIISKK
jgi:poly-gamma-glutamate synthesis protein (capsule biosynthesis protein)